MTSAKDCLIFYQNQTWNRQKSVPIQLNPLPYLSSTALCTNKFNTLTLCPKISTAKKLIIQNFLYLSLGHRSSLGINLRQANCHLYGDTTFFIKRTRWDDNSSLNCSSTQVRSSKNKKKIHNIRINIIYSLGRMYQPSLT